MHLPYGLLFIRRDVASCLGSTFFCLLRRLEQQVEWVSAVLHLEQLHKQAEHNDEHRKPEVYRDTLLGGVELTGDEDSQGDDAKAKEAICESARAVNKAGFQS
jgi:hypothetical protein